MSAPEFVSSVVIRREQDVLVARQRARHIAEFLGFSSGDITRITTAVSELARNAFEYGGGGIVGFGIEKPKNRQELVISVVDSGRGIPDISAVLSPDFRSRNGMGVGLKGSRALMDRFDLTSVVGHGTTVMIAKRLPSSSAHFGSAEAIRLREGLASANATTPFGELELQNQALLSALHELTQRQAEIDRLRIIADNASVAADEARAVAMRSLLVRERFMALTTHEFRTPLNAILGYLDLLDVELAAFLTETQTKYVKRMRIAALHLATMTSDFLEMAKDDSGLLDVDLIECSAYDAMLDASTFLAPQATLRRVTLDVGDVCEPMKYRGDSKRVRQVLVNILANAVSFTPIGGRVEMTCSRVASSPEGTSLASGNWIGIGVQDTGPGIPEDKLLHVFEPFVQVSSDGQASRMGTGLGLTVSRQLALRMGGDLTATSAGTGALFTLWLPEWE